MIIRTRDGYPCAHPHLSSDLLATQDRPTSYSSPVYASGYHAPHRENGVQRVTSIQLSNGTIGRTNLVWRSVAARRNRRISSRLLRNAEARPSKVPVPVTSRVCKRGPSKRDEAARPVTSKPASRVTVMTGFT